MNAIRVLIVDDSIIYRSQIRAALTSFPHLELVGTANNGRMAMETLNKVSIDLVILDMEMPEMDGLQTLLEMRKIKSSAKVLLFSSQTARGAQITLEALRLGASDFVTKPDETTNSLNQNPANLIRQLLEPKIDALFPRASSQPPQTSKKTQSVFELETRPKAIVIGCSTGGPNVLETIFSDISKKCKGPLPFPVFIVQHMPPLFTKALAQRLERLSGWKVVEATHGEPVQNCVYVAPGDYHMVIETEDNRAVISLEQSPKVHFVRPAVDPLFISAARCYGRYCVGFVLTGMGSDGLHGCKEVKAGGGSIIIQNQESCVVFGMPGAVQQSGLQDAEMNPDQIQNCIIKTLNSSLTKAA